MSYRLLKPSLTVVSLWLPTNAQELLLLSSGLDFAANPASVVTVPESRSDSICRGGHSE